MVVISASPPVPQSKLAVPIMEVVYDRTTKYESDGRFWFCLRCIVVEIQSEHVVHQPDVESLITGTLNPNQRTNCCQNHYRVLYKCLEPSSSPSAPLETTDLCHAHTKYTSYNSNACLMVLMMYISYSKTIFHLPTPIHLLSQAYLRSEYTDSGPCRGWGSHLLGPLYFNRHHKTGSCVIVSSHSPVVDNYGHRQWWPHQITRPQRRLLMIDRRLLWHLQIIIGEALISTICLGDLESNILKITDT